MGRQHRLGQQFGHHHVVNRGIDQRTVFHGDEDRVDFGQLIRNAHERTGVFVNAYCLMGNHFHLVLDCPEGGLSDFMHHVASQFARRWHLRHGGDGPVFRGRFASRPIGDERYRVSAVRYVHRNPLAFLPASKLLDYRWSSLRAYAGLRRAPNWLQCEPVRSWSGGREALVALTIGELPPGDAPLNAAELTAAIALAIEPTALDTGVTRSTTAIALIAAELAQPPNLHEVVRALVPTTPGAADRARRRARQLSSSNPLLVTLADAALDILGVPRARTSGAGSEMSRR